MIYVYAILLSLVFNQVHFTDIPDETGVHQLIVIENVLGLELGDEIGLFDLDAELSFGNCESQRGELLVGSGIWTGSQLDIVAIGSLDACPFGGFLLPGWIEDNSIMIKVWDASDNMEYDISEINYTTGTGNWGDLYSVIDFLVVPQLSTDLIDGISLFNLYPNPFNSFITFDINSDYQNKMKISIYDLLGNNIYNSENKGPIIWDASDYESGIYLVQFSSNSLTLTKKITLIK